MALTLELGEFTQTYKIWIKLYVAYVSVSHLGKGCIQAIPVCEVLHTLKVNLQHLPILPKRNQTLTPDKINVFALCFKEMKKECQSRHILLILALILEYFNISPSYRVQLRMRYFQVI